MPVSKKRTKNNRPTQSKNISTQMASGKGPSPKWYVITMSSLMIIGVLLILFLLFLVIMKKVSKWYLWSGLALIGGGFLMTTNYN